MEPTREDGGEKEGKSIGLYDINVPSLNKLLNQP
jgi:hypothetical protein